MMRQTAIQYLIQEIKNAYVHSKSTIEWNDIFQKAKAMEKEQMELAWEEGAESEYQYHINSEYRKDSKSYYNETYGGDHSVDTNEMIDHIGDVNEMVNPVPDVRKMVEDDVVKLAEEYAFKVYHAFEDATWFRPLNLGYYAGYNKAKETLYTEEQVRDAIDRARNYYDGWVETENEIIQSLKQPKQ
jgi:hypothetical protein